MLLSRLKDGKSRAGGETPNPRARFGFSATFKNIHVYPERSKSGQKTKFLAQDQMTVPRAGQELHRRRAGSRENRLLRAHPPAAPISKSPPPPPARILSHVPDAAGFEQAADNAGSASAAASAPLPRKRKAGRRHPPGKALVPRASLSGPRN